jgi:hypothetical protein
VDAADAVWSDMGVDLGGVEAGVPEEAVTLRFPHQRRKRLT